MKVSVQLDLSVKIAQIEIRASQMSFHLRRLMSDGYATKGLSKLWEQETKGDNSRNATWIFTGS